jgi:O-antigen chain-terminating methyltransferase
MLRLYKDLGLRGIGIDLNESMVKRCIKLGFDARQDNALSYLRAQRSSSVAALSGIHIVEHIPFESLLSLLKEAFRVVAPGGFVLFETPNAENVVVGSLTFWYDSSHIKPVPPDVLAFMLQYAGFNETKLIRMRPDKELSQEVPDELTKKMAQRLFGPRDYVAVGYKSKSKII